MTLKLKKRLYIFSILIIVFIIFCFYIGYKIPERDKHTAWTTLESNSDKQFYIEKTIQVKCLIKTGNANRMLAFYKDSVCIIDSAGGILHKFDADENVLIDSFHNRLIAYSTVAVNDSVKADEYQTYNLETFESTPIKLNKFYLRQTYKDFLKQKNIALEYHVDSAEEYHKKDSIYTLQYKAAQKEAVDFFSRLHPVIEVDDDVNPLYAKLFTDESGKIYEISSANDNDMVTYDYFSESMRKLYPDWRNVPDIEQNMYKPGFFVADKSVITGNEFNFNSGIVLFSPTGGTGGGMSMYFDQNYLNYYGVKIKNDTLHFKMYDNIHIIYIEKDLWSFQQLNIPQTDKDTLAFLFDHYLYRVYHRK